MDLYIYIIRYALDGSIEYKYSLVGIGSDDIWTNEPIPKPIIKHLILLIKKVGGNVYFIKKHNYTLPF